MAHHPDAGTKQWLTPWACLQQPEGLFWWKQELADWLNPVLYWEHLFCSHTSRGEGVCDLQATGIIASRWIEALPHGSSLLGAMPINNVNTTWESWSQLNTAVYSSPWKALLGWQVAGLFFLQENLTETNQTHNGTWILLDLWGCNFASGVTSTLHPFIYTNYNFNEKLSRCGIM